MIARPLAPAAVTATASAPGRFRFGFGPRFFFLLAAGTLLAIPAWIDPRAVAVLIAWNVILIALWTVDLRRIDPSRGLEATRSWRAPLALGVGGRVHIALRNNSAISLQAVATDDVPAALRRSLPSFALEIAAGGEQEAGYDITPALRGDATLGSISLRCRSAWGIAERWLAAPLPQTVRVYPDLFESRRQSLFLIRSRQVALEKRRARVAALGRDFESLREYQPGDDVRDICWTATARRGKPVTKVYQPERSQAVWILVDGGRLLRARIGTRMKLDAMVDGALSLAEVALAAGDRVGLVTYGRRVHRRLTPSRGRQHLRAILDALAILPGERAEADHGAAAAAVLSVQKQRALVVWLTDLSETAGVPDVIEHAARLSPQHVVLFALIQQPELATLGASTPGSESQMYRMLAAHETLERREVLLRTLSQRGVLVVDLPQDGPGPLLIDQYLRVKDRNLV